MKVIMSRYYFDACLPITRQSKVAETQKVAGRLLVTFCNSSKVKGQSSRSPGRLTPRLKVSHVLGSGRPTSGHLQGAGTYRGGRPTRLVVVHCVRL